MWKIIVDRWNHDTWTSKCIEFDKWTHAGGSCLATCLLRIFTWNAGTPWIAGGVVFVLGILYETYQEISLIHKFSIKDVIANCVGIALGMIV